MAVPPLARDSERHVAGTPIKRRRAPPGTMREGMQLSVRAVRRSLWSRLPMAAAIVSLLALLATTSMGAGVVHAAANNSPRTTTAAAPAAPHRAQGRLHRRPDQHADPDEPDGRRDARQRGRVATAWTSAASSSRTRPGRTSWPTSRARTSSCTWATATATPAHTRHGLTESRQNGMGLNTFDGSSPTQYTYYGANLLQAVRDPRAERDRLPEPPVLLRRQRRAGTAIPTYDVARQRVDNMANGWLATGAKAVFAYAQQLFDKTLNALFDPTTDYSVEDIFRIPGRQAERVLRLGRLGCAQVRLRAHARRDELPRSRASRKASTAPSRGDLTMTASQWKAGPGDAGAPNLRNLAGADRRRGDAGRQRRARSSRRTATASPTRVNLSYTTDKETFVDWQVKDAGGNVVRNFSSWTVGGRGTAVWNGKRDDGSYVGDGTYTVTATPSSRAGNAGASSERHGQRPDDDGLAQRPRRRSSTPLTATLSRPARTCRCTLTQPATLSWVVVDRNNNVVRTNLTDAATPAGNVDVALGRQERRRRVRPGRHLLLA